MTSRDRVMVALNHQRPDRTPRLLYGEVTGYVPAIDKLLRERCSPKSPREYFDMDVTGVVPNPTKLSMDRFAEWLPGKFVHLRYAGGTAHGGLLGHYRRLASEAR